MGYEVIYNYYEKKENGYDKEEVKTFKKKVGDPFEDIPMEKLVTSMMSQFARRDIWITDAEVYELTKKKISFKETKDGLILKNKKYLFEGSVDSSYIVSQEIEENQKPTNIAPTNIAPSIQPSNSQSQISGKTYSAKTPVDWVIFLPELRQLPMVSKYRLTRDKKYPVYRKRMKSSGVGQELTIEDDIGREITIVDDFFVPAQINLVADKELGFTKKQDIPSENLLFWNEMEEDATMPDIRKGK